MKRNYLLFTALFVICTIDCSYPIRKQEVLEEDRGFLFPDEKDPSFQCNQGAVKASRVGKIEHAEALWDECIKLYPDQIITHLNRLHLYFLLEEFEIVKEKIEREAPKPNSIFYKKLLEELNARVRWEERVVVLDALSRVRGWEIFAFEELAKYYMYNGNFGFSESYWNQILQINPFHEEALFGMLEIQSQKGKWYAVLDYAKSLSLAAKKNRDFHYFYVKANFELGRYPEALKWADSATESEKSQISFLEVWRDCLLLTKDQPNWTPLLPYYKKAISQGYTISESVFFPTIDPAGKELRKAIRSGRQ